ncbi:hypothetical protein P154DRAFT_589116 [Amniculicola lignicola CBS 123094]|uniref:Isomerase YbhE n=1 Tax=Amniculicola lignicola CBS 123094 TaxID=1392246 RepID=A0A6A5VVF1_9PLEO|nr:hypothetical protein P154DRAFT_589116 [Amniculicola lignicola CBS 123094]
MRLLTSSVLFMGVAQAAIHHLFKSKYYLFGSRPSDGTVSRYSVGTDLALKHEGTMEIPSTCNATSFTKIQLTTGSQRPYSIYGSASTGTCSALFSVSVTGFQTLQSGEYVGDIRSLAFSPNGQHLYALDYKSNSILNFNITEDPSLQDLIEKGILSNVTTPRQIVTHPTGHRIYVVTEDTNQLIDIPLLPNDSLNTSSTPVHFNVLPKSLQAEPYTTHSVAITSNSTLWALSRTWGQTVLSVFSLDPETGEVLKAIARSAWADYSETLDSWIVGAPFGSDIIAVTNSPIGMVAVVGLVNGQLKGFQRLDLITDPGCCGESVWLD